MKIIEYLLGTNKSDYLMNSLKWFSYLLIFAYILFFTGFIHRAPNTLLIINTCIKLIISLYLIYRYNDILQETNLKFTELDRFLVFNIAVFNIIIIFTDMNILEKTHNFIEKNIITSASTSMPTPIQIQTNFPTNTTTNTRLTTII